MTLRLALRALASRPVRTAVLACGFGFGIAVMAALIGVGDVILDQARSPALKGGGDLLVTGASGPLGSARHVASSVLQSPPLAGRARVASPSVDARLYLVRPGHVVPVRARGGIPSLERALGDPETAGIEVWADAPGDAAWSSPDPSDVLRAMDRFHAVPDVPAHADSWAEWLYFNGASGDTRFYLTFLFGPRNEKGNRQAGVRLQLERGGTLTSYADAGEVSEEALLASAPDVAIGSSRVTLEGLRYRITLALPGASGELTLDATPGRSMQPVAIRGAGGWVSGYVVPVLAGELGGTLRVGRDVVRLDGGTGYHDHNWGFWKDVSWQWGQVAGDGVSIVYGRVRPPADVADPARIPGFLAVLGNGAPLGFATNVSIEEIDDPSLGRPRRIVVTAEGESVELRMELEVTGAVASRWDRAARGGTSLIQMRAGYRVEGRIADRTLSFSAHGSAETFR